MTAKAIDRCEFGASRMPLPIPAKPLRVCGDGPTHLQARLYKHVCNGRLVIYEKCLNIPIALTKKSFTMVAQLSIHSDEQP